MQTSRLVLSALVSVVQSVTSLELQHDTLPPNTQINLNRNSFLSHSAGKFFFSGESVNDDSVTQSADVRYVGFVHACLLL